MYCLNFDQQYESVEKILLVLICSEILLNDFELYLRVSANRKWA